jgi:2,3-bisphosphoglycerate-dependent phosphoglycerate mutase
VLALIRHGKTGWNGEGRFIGWHDDELTEAGRAQAERAGATLADLSARWDAVHTSCLRRAIETARIAAEGFSGPPEHLVGDWRLNARHVGALEGELHAEVADRHGDEAAQRWRWGVNEPPPLLSVDDRRHQAHVRRYPELGSGLPRGESLRDVARRLRPWLDEVKRDLHADRSVIAFTHGTTLRAFRLLVEELPAESAFSVRPANGEMLVYALDGDSLRPVSI